MEIRDSSLLLYFASLFHNMCAGNTSIYPDSYSILTYGLKDNYVRELRHVIQVFENYSVI